MTVIHKVSAEKSADLEFVLSDATLDRYGDIVDPAGWVLTNFKKNPIALFGHSSSFPIGTWSNVRVEGKKLLARLNFAARGTSARIDELISLVEQGILRAVSVGFRPLEAEPIDKDKPYAGQRYTKQELLECSLVTVPALPSALALAKSLNISPETISLAFGEHADVRLRDMSTTGEHAASHPHVPKKDKSMKTLSQRIEDATNSLVAKKDKLAELTGAEVMDFDAVEELNTQIETEERGLSLLKASEAKIGAAAANLPAPAIVRRPLSIGQKDVGGLDLLVRRALVRSCALYSERSVDEILAERYPGHEATAAITKAAQTLGTTGTAGWVAELQQTSYAALLDALRGKSIYPELRARGMGLNFDAAGSVYIPSLVAGGANGSFFAEGTPMRVGRITTAGQTMTPRKMGVIIPFSREAAKRSTPNLEGLIKKAIVDDTGAVLDSVLLDATAGDTVRPAGLLNGVAAVSTGFAGGDYQAVKEDFKALLKPFIDANAAANIAVIMNASQGLSQSLMDGPLGNADWFKPIRDRVTIIESTRATAGRLIAVRAEDFATAMGDTPEFELSNQATIHMEDATPLEIVSATGPTTANPVRSFFQTDSMGVRMVMDVSWKMVRSGMVQWVNGTSW